MKQDRDVSTTPSWGSGAKLLRTIRVRNRHEPGVLGRLATTLGEQGATIGNINTSAITEHFTIRDFEVLIDDAAHLQRVVEAIGALSDTVLLEVRDEVLEAHLGGKIRMVSRLPITSIAQLGKVYTPGVAEVCLNIRDRPDLAYSYTSISRTVAIVTDGTAILGLGNIGPVAGMPVMEGKAALLEQLVGLSGVPILVDSTRPDDIVRAVQLIAPSFGAIQLEDIGAPACFEVEQRLRNSLEMPVFQDDQQGTAAVALAAMLGACRLTGRSINTVIIGVIGLGAAGLSIAALLHAYTGTPILGADIDPEAIQRHLATGNEAGTLGDVMAQCDLVVATTGVEGLIKPEMVRRGQVILALSNPKPEILPAVAVEAGAAYAADGASVNNVLGFPGLLRGALEVNARRFTDSMYLAAGLAIADAADEGELVPRPLDRGVHLAVTLAVARAAVEAGVARRPFDEELLAATFTA